MRYAKSQSITNHFPEVTHTMSESDNVAYRSRVRLERIKGPLRIAHLPIDGETVFGVHSEVAEHYGVSPQISEPHATTLDYIVAATSG